MKQVMEKDMAMQPGDHKHRVNTYHDSFGDRAKPVVRVFVGVTLDI